MKLIRVTYRATFQQPKVGPLNRIGARISTPISVEVYGFPSGWCARTPTESEAQNPPWPLIRASTAEQMRSNVAEQFETELTPWQMWGNPGTKMDQPRLLQPEEVEIRENGQVYFKDPPAAAVQSPASPKEPS